MARAREQIDRDNEYRQRLRDLTEHVGRVQTQLSRLSLRLSQVEKQMQQLGEVLNPDQDDA